MTGYGYCVTHLIVHCKPCWRIILPNGIKVSQAAKAPLIKMMNTSRSHILTSLLCGEIYPLDIIAVIIIN